MLSVLYPNMRFQTEVFHQDHIHPASRFHEAQFAKLGLSQEQRSHWLKHRDTVANLQFLQGRVNQEKGASPLMEWMKRMPEADRANFSNANYFPEGVGLEFAKFEEFHQKRKEIMRGKLREELAIASELSRAQLDDREELEEINDEEA